MYWLYKKHHVLPSVFLSLSENEQIVLRAFFLEEMDEIKKEQEKIEEIKDKAGKG